MDILKILYYGLMDCVMVITKFHNDTDDLFGGRDFPMRLTNFLV